MVLNLSCSLVPPGELLKSLGSATLRKGSTQECHLKMLPAMILTNVPSIRDTKFIKS